MASESCYGIILSKGRILLLRRELGSHFVWELPGGNINEGETGLECALRETLEETGLRCKPAEPLTQFAGETTKKIFAFVLEPENTEVVLSQEHGGHAWLDMEEFRKLPNKALSLQAFDLPLSLFKT